MLAKSPKNVKAQREIPYKMRRGYDLHKTFGNPQSRNWPATHRSDREFTFSHTGTCVHAQVL